MSTIATLHPDISKAEPLAWCVVVPDDITGFEHTYRVFPERQDASLFADALAEAIYDQRGSEASPDDVQIYPLRATTT